jgi:hypothetical protein
MAALSFNQSNVGRGIGRPGRDQPQPLAPFTPNGFGCGRQFAPHGFGRGGQGRGRGCGHGRGPTGFATGRGPPITTITAGRATGYMSPQAAGGGYYATPPQAQHIQAPPYLNLMKRFANWNACYSCGFDIPDRHTSQTCPQHLRNGPRHSLHQAECAAAHRPRVQLRHKEPPQDGVPTDDVTVRGDGRQRSV